MIGVRPHVETPSTHLFKHVLHIRLFAVARKDDIAAKQLKGVQEVLLVHHTNASASPAGKIQETS